MHRSTAVALALAAFLSACGTSPAEQPALATSASIRETTTTTAPVEKSAVFDFSAIAGDWVGTLESQRSGVSATFPAEVSLDAGARRGSVVGTFSYPDTADPCRGTLSALRVDEFEYLVFHAAREGDCNPSAWSGQVRLLYNSQTGELNYSLTIEFGAFVGTLERVSE